MPNECWEIALTTVDRNTFTVTCLSVDADHLRDSTCNTFHQTVILLFNVGLKSVSSPMTSGGALVRFRACSYYWKTGHCCDYCWPGKFQEQIRPRCVLCLASPVIRGHTHMYRLVYSSTTNRCHEQYRDRFTRRFPAVFWVQLTYIDNRISKISHVTFYQ